MSWRLRALAPLAAAMTLAAPVQAMDWRQAAGTEITLLASEHPWTAGVREHLAEFEAKTGIKVNVSAFAEDLYLDRANLALRATEPVADVYMSLMDGALYDQWLAGGVESLSGYLADPAVTDPGYDVAGFPASFLVGASYPPGEQEAQQYALPISFEAYILFYNRELVDRYLGGKLPATMDELTAAAQKISAEGKGEVFGAAMRGQRSASLVDTMTGVVLNDWGAQPAPLPYNIWFDGSWEKPRFDDPRIAGGLAHYAGLLKGGPENALNFGWEDATRFFSQGRAAFFVDASVFGPGFEDRSASKVAGKVGYAPLPPAKGDTGYSGHWAWGLSMTKNSKNKTAAWLFIQWATSKEMDAVLGAKTGGAPRLSSWSDPAYVGKLDAGYVQAVQAAMQHTRPTMVFRQGWGEVVLMIVDAIHEIYAGKPPQDAADELQENVKGIL